MNKINKNILKNTTVLYVDDEKEIRDKIEYFLAEYLEELYVAPNAKEAIKLFKEKRPDIIITDIQMPGMNGIEMLKQMDIKNQIPVVITTAHSDADYFIEAIELKVDKFVMKPIDLVELVETIQTLIEGSKLKQRLIENNKLLEIIDENVLMSITDEEGVIVDVSSAFCQFVGYSKNELIGHTHRILKDENNEKSFYENMWKVIKEGKVFKSELRNRKKSNEICWVNLTISPLFHNNKIENFIAIRQDITNRKELEKLAIHDPMTGLYNRRFLNEVVEKEIRRIKREGSVLSLVTMDVDYFKRYNDKYGHPAGDKVLIEIAKVLKKHAQRATDYCFRMGGEEFGIIFSNLKKEDSLIFVQEMIKAVENLKIIHENSVCSKYVTISAGLIVESSKHLDSFKKLYKYSDEALYKAKKNGKNQVVLSENSL